MRSPQSASGSVVVCGTTTAGQGRHVAVRFLKPAAEAGARECTSATRGCEPMQPSGWRRSLRGSKSRRPDREPAVGCEAARQSPVNGTFATVNPLMSESWSAEPWRTGAAAKRKTVPKRKPE